MEEKILELNHPIIEMNLFNPSILLFRNSLPMVRVICPRWKLLWTIKRSNRTERRTIYWPVSVHVRCSWSATWPVSMTTHYPVACSSRLVRLFPGCHGYNSSQSGHNLFHLFKQELVTMLFEAIENFLVHHKSAHTSSSKVKILCGFGDNNLDGLVMAILCTLCS